MSSRSFVSIVFALLFFLFAPLLLSAQVEMSLGGDLVLCPADADASAYYKTLDVNDKVCALLKVRPSNPISGTLMLDTDAGMATVKAVERQNGE